jgi:hypothetical protein
MGAGSFLVSIFFSTHPYQHGNYGQNSADIFSAAGHGRDHSMWAGLMIGLEAVQL